MAVFCPLYSGSSGNSVYLDGGESALLIDLGVSCRAAVTALQSLGADFQKLKGILITHEHSDHIKGLPVFLKKYPLPLFGSRAVLDYLQENVQLPENVQQRLLDGASGIGKQWNQTFYSGTFKPEQQYGSTGTSGCPAGTGAGGICAGEGLYPAGGKTQGAKYSRTDLEAKKKDSRLRVLFFLGFIWCFMDRIKG